ncbi:MAG TPA: hypothetical protein VN667_04535 [Burkholderiales bacterium]|nr:hypothetical protein [Burkholderiales bacterium]
MVWIAGVVMVVMLVYSIATVTKDMARRPGNPVAQAGENPDKDQETRPQTG